MLLIKCSKNMVDIIAGWPTPGHSSKANAVLQLLQRHLPVIANGIFACDALAQDRIMAVKSAVLH